MHALRDLSIGQKLERITLVTCGVSILMACTALALYDGITFRKEMASAMASAAGIAGSNTTAALAFSDAKAAREVLASLRAQPNIVEACVYTRDGTVFAKYARQGSDPDFTPPVRRPNGAEFTFGHLTVFRSIQLNGEDIGTIYLNSDLAELYARTERFAEIVFLVIAVSFLMAYLLSSRLQRVITGPILELARTASVICREGNYSLRAAKSSGDEIGSLADGFNEMLGQIQAREAALHKAHDELEARVNERTRDLQKEVAERTNAERALQERTAFLNSLIENNPVAIVALDAAEIVQMCNPAFEDIFRCRQQDIVGRPLFELLSTPEIDSELDANRKRLRDGHGIHTITRRRRTDGTLVDVEAFSVPLGSPEKFTGILVLYQDITGRKQHEEALLRAKDAAEAANQAKSEFLANMSHEIRTPMNGIIGMTELALETSLTAQQREYLGLVKTSADSLLSLINDILDFSKIEAGKLDIDKIDFPVAQTLGETLKALSLRAHGKGLELAWRVGPGVPAYLKGDVGRLRQIVVNLLGNALKFTEQGEVVLEVEKEAEDERGVLLHFRVRDTGIGVPAEKHKMIFDAFTQADSSSTRKYGGTGLGLAITSRLVRLMGGRIWVESELGHGSTFHFTVRFEVADTSGQPVELGHPDQIRNLPVLVVDDNRTNRLILVEMLSAWGMRPETAEGGRAALTALGQAYERGTPFQLVITDMQMPEMDGLALSEAIRADSALRELPILLLSSSVQHGEAARCRQLGISKYLTKPVQPSELFEAILSARAKPEEVHDVSPAPPSPPEDKKQGIRILLAEDNAVNRKLATTLLEKRGYTVVVTENGREALEALERESVDLVLMDVQMPVMDGFEAIRAIRAKERSTGTHLPIIAVTAHAMKGDRERGLAAGADDYVTKPIRIQDLLAAMERFQSKSAGTAPPSPSGARVPAAGVLDVAVALERVGGDRELFEEILQLFAAECPKSVAEIRQAWNARDAHLLEGLAHTMKGAAASVSAHRVSEAAAELEKYARAGDLGNSGELIEHLSDEVERLLPEIETLCRKVAP
ncbi:MAG TPA: response regulator [Candidatus Acidoferrales bacterium]|nr:response regulator [Candidatus Acidoferrales bacterium]